METDFDPGNQVVEKDYGVRFSYCGKRVSGYVQEVYEDRLLVERTNGGPPTEYMFVGMENTIFYPHTLDLERKDNPPYVMVQSREIPGLYHDGTERTRTQSPASAPDLEGSH